MSGIMCAIVGGSPGSIGGTVGTLDLNPSDAQVNAPASATFTLNSSGGYVALNDSSGSYATPGSLASGLEAKLDFVSGDNELSGAATGTWLSLGTTRTWALPASIGLYKYGVFTLTLREIVSQQVRDTSTITFDAESAFI